MPEMVLRSFQCKVIAGMDALEQQISYVHLFEILVQMMYFNCVRLISVGFQCFCPICQWSVYWNQFHGNFSECFQFLVPSLWWTFDPQISLGVPTLLWVNPSDVSMKGIMGFFRCISTCGNEFFKIPFILTFVYHLLSLKTLPWVLVKWGHVFRKFT